MQKLILILVSVLCLNTFSFGQSAKVQLTGVNTRFITVIPMVGEFSRHEITHCVDEGSVAIELKNIDPARFYVMGVNNRVLFFMPDTSATLKIDFQADNSYKITGGDQKLNDLLSTISNESMYDFQNSLVNYYIGQVIWRNYANVDMDVLCNESYKDTLEQWHNKLCRMVEKSKIKDKAMRARLDRLANDLYWEMVFVTHADIRTAGRRVPQYLLEMISNFDFTNSSYTKGRLRDLILVTYVEVQQKTGNIKNDFSNYISTNAQCLKIPEVRDHYVLTELQILIERKQFSGNVKKLVNESEKWVSEKSKGKFNKLRSDIFEIDAKNIYDGKPTLTLSLPDQNGKSVSLDQFRGKYIYIDLWATWCGPCKQEIPALKQLEKELEGKNIQFISISLDRKEQEWKSYLEQHNLKGVTLFAPDGFNTPFISHYKVHSIPRFMLIGPDGTMIFNNCWRPSDPKLKAYLLSLLGDK